MVIDWRCYVAQVAQHVNGPLLEILAQSCGFHDAACIELFRKGGEIVGTLPFAGNGKKIVEFESAEKLAAACGLTAARAERNADIIASMRVEEYPQELLRQAKEDANLGRMSRTRLLSLNEFEQLDTSDVNISPRFSVVQGDVPR